MDNIKFLLVVAGHIEAGTLFRSGVLSNKQIADHVRSAAAELKGLRLDARLAAEIKGLGLDACLAGRSDDHQHP